MKRSFVVNSARSFSGLFPIIDSNLLPNDLKTQHIQLLNYICTVYSTCIIKCWFNKMYTIERCIRPISVKIRFISETSNRCCCILLIHQITSPYYTRVIIMILLFKHHYKIVYNLASTRYCL